MTETDAIYAPIP